MRPHEDSLKFCAELHAAFQAERVRAGGYGSLEQWLARWPDQRVLVEREWRALFREDSLDRAEGASQGASGEPSTWPSASPDGGRQGRPAPSAVGAAPTPLPVHREAPDLRPVGARWDRYVLGEELGRGGQGVVQAAVEEGTGRAVALKFLHPVLAADPKQRRRFAREARILAALQHRSICPVLACALEGATPWIAMPRIFGRSFLEHLRAEDSWPLSKDENQRRLGWLCEVASALEHAHAKGVLHRDLKPANVMLARDGSAVLMDFGLARPQGESPLGSGEATSGLFGTVSYLAPELVSGAIARADPQTDLFAFGLLAAEALTGHNPVRGAYQAETLRRLAEGQRTPWPAGVEQQKEMLAVLERATAHQRVQRYASVADLRADLEALSEGRSPSVRRAPRWRRWWGAVRRHPRTSAFAAALTLTLLGWAGTSIYGAHALAEERDALAARTAEVRSLALFERAEALAAEEAPLGAGTPWRPAAQSARRGWMERARALLAEAGSPEPLLATWSRDDPAYGPLQDWNRRYVAARATIARRMAQAERGAARDARWLERAAGRDAVAWAAVRARTGLALQPGLGLVPLGPNPRTALEEFALLGTGEVPQRAAGGGALAVSEASALVFVLLPGGRAQVGAREDTPHPDYAGGAGQEVLLAPYFIARTEISLAQSRHLAPPGARFPMEAMDATGAVPGQAHQAELPGAWPNAYLTWHQARRLAAVAGCALPTEAQWEFAAQAHGDGQGRSEPAPDWVHWANGWDRSHSRWMRVREAAEVSFDDGHPWLAPAWPSPGSFEANAFGLFHVVGNAAEWVREEASTPRTSLRPGDGAAGPDATQAAMHKGGHALRSAPLVHLAYRWPVSPVSNAEPTGVRLVRPAHLSPLR